MNDVAILAGVLLAFLTYLGNMVYQESRRRRECREELRKLDQEQQDEHRKKELHAAEMQLLAAQLKQVEQPNGPHSNSRDSRCSTE